MNYTKRPISDTALRINSTLHRVVSTSFSKNDPAFSGMFKDSFEYYTIENGMAKQIGETEDQKGLKVTLVHVDDEGRLREELPANEASVEVEIPYNQDGLTFKPDVWCDDAKLAKELCAEKNREAKARLEKIANEVKSKVDFIDNLIDIEG